MKSLHVFGPFRGPTGYDHVVRNVVQRLYFKGITVGLHEFKAWSGVEIPVNVLYGNMEKTASACNSNAMLAFCLPEQVHRDCPHGGRLLVNYTMVETDRIPNDWVDCGSLTDLIIVPTEFNKNAWAESGVNENRVEVVPLGVDQGFYNPSIDPLNLYDGDQLLTEKYQYRFMNIQEVVDRKNLRGLLRAWIQATKGVDDACLILKLSSYTGNKTEFFVSYVDEIRKELGITKGEHAPIFAYMNMLTDIQMPQLLNVCTHYISSSCGEGWDLSMIAAASMDKQLIAPRNSSYTTYLNDDIATIVSCQKEPARQPGPTQRIYQGSSWHRPDEDELADAIEYGLRGQKRAESARKHIVDNFTWDHTVDKLVDVMDDRIFNDKPSILPPKSREDRSGVLIGCKSVIGESRCGIAEYSKSLTQALQDMPEKMSKIGLMGGGEQTYLDHVDNNSVKGVHFQYEYQFHDPSRLKFMFRELKSRDVKILVTQHTLSRDAASHNAVIKEMADAVIVHSDCSVNYAVDELGYDPEKVHRVIMPCRPIMDQVENVMPLPQDRLKIGFFGFSYFHKGISKLIVNYFSLKQHEAFQDLMLVIVSNKPAQDSVGYYEQCVNMMLQFGLKPNQDYLWFDKFLPEEQVVGFLQQCDCVILPYDDYGGVGTSAAIRTVMSAGRPVFASDTCWFSDIPEMVVPRLHDESFESELKSCISGLRNKQYAEALSNRIVKYVGKNTWEKAAEQHREIYQKVVDTSSLTSSKNMIAMS